MVNLNRSIEHAAILVQNSPYTYYYELTEVTYLQLCTGASNSCSGTQTWVPRICDYSELEWFHINNIPVPWNVADFKLVEGTGHKFKSMNQLLVFQMFVSRPIIKDFTDIKFNKSEINEIEREIFKSVYGLIQSDLIKSLEIYYFCNHHQNSLTSQGQREHQTDHRLTIYHLYS